jgi:hypothetical protein
LSFLFSLAARSRSRFASFLHFIEQYRVVIFDARPASNGLGIQVAG